VLRRKNVAMDAYIKKYRKISNKQPNAASQTPRKTRISSSEMSRKRDKNKSQTPTQHNNKKRKETTMRVKRMEVLCP
jgi:hypothetical protein